MDSRMNCKYYKYKRVVESYIGRNKERTEYTRAACVDLCVPVCMLVKLCGLSDKNLKHRTYLDNYTFVFPLLKESYMGKSLKLTFLKICL